MRRPQGSRYKIEEVTKGVAWKAVEELQQRLSVQLRGDRGLPRTSWGLNQASIRQPTPQLREGGVTQIACVQEPSHASRLVLIGVGTAVHAECSRLARVRNPKREGGNREIRECLHAAICLFEFLELAEEERIWGLPHGPASRIGIQKFKGYGEGGP